MENAARKLGSNIPQEAPPTKPTHVKIVLEDTDRIPPTGQYFGLNGKGFMLRAGEEARVPVGIVEILDNAIEAHPRLNGVGQVIGTRNRHRFPYRVVREEVEG
jgi:hypothetical protein